MGETFHVTWLSTTMCGEYEWETFCLMSQAHVPVVLPNGKTMGHQDVKRKCLAMSPENELEDESVRGTLGHRLLEIAPASLREDLESD